MLSLSVKYPIKFMILIGIMMTYTHGYTQQYEVLPLKINSKDADFSGAFLGNDIVFCSARARVDLSFDDDSLTLYYTDLYLARQKSDGSFAIPEVIKGAVNTDFNEGHCTFSKDGKWMYYTANLKKSLDSKVDRTQEFKLGIFIAENVAGNWIPRGEFPYNSANSKYSNAHPSLSENDSMLYFCSNMPGGKGNSDIYRCRWINGSWSTPENLVGVNTKGNEFFPFISESDVLYFSTDARNDSEGMDIYSSEEVEGEFQEPKRLNSTINSEFDEFAYQEKRGSNIGLFSSNRNEEQDDIFMFRKFNDNTNDCLENYQANFCYHFYDTELAQLGNLPIKYMWDMGDGQTFQADSVNYCFKNYGDYHVTLSVVDTITKIVFKTISETDIAIMQADRPFIHCHDSIPQNARFEGEAEFTAFAQFPPKKIRWEMDDGTIYFGPKFQHSFKTPGMHQIKCAVSGEKKKGGINPFVCVYKNIYCTPSDQPTDALSVVACCDKNTYKKKKMTSYTAIKGYEAKATSRHEIVLSLSKTKLKADDPLLNIKDVHVKETLTDSGYIYTVAETASWQELLPLYAKLKEAGVEKMYAIETTLDIKGNNPQAGNLDDASSLHAAQNAKSNGNVQNNAKTITSKQTEVSTSKPNNNTVDENITQQKETTVAKHNADQINSKSENAAAVENVAEEITVLPNFTKNATDTQQVATTATENKTETVEIKTNTTDSISYKQDNIGTNAIVANNTNITSSAEPSQTSTIPNTNSSVPSSTTNSKENLSELTPQIQQDQPQSEAQIQTTPAQPTQQLTESSTSAAPINRDEVKITQNIVGKADNPNVGDQKPTDSSSNNNNVESPASDVASNEKSKINSAKPERILYRIVLRTSDRPLSFNDVSFKGITSEINEIKNESGYAYTILGVPAEKDLQKRLQELQNSGLKEAKTEAFDANKLSAELSRKGYFMQQGSADKINLEFSQLPDVKFEYNSFEIKAESHKVLNYIAAMMKLEEDFTLKIDAHTCSVGGNKFNQQLSEQRAKEVMKYLVSKGIDQKRLIPQGFGMERPFTTNESEMGRAANRRVEFTVVYSIKK
jgi:outer membrane protein OmpA-like peptidoglycan-associated protein